MSPGSIAGVGLCAPGMLDWSAARRVLRDEDPWRPEDLPRLDVPLLPVAERRRISPAPRIAIAAAAQAVADWPAGMASIQSVFATANGDGHVLASTLQTLAEDPGALSPTVFHNSVFNAAAGYWAIASRSRAPSTTVSAGEGSFAAGVLEAIVELTLSRSPVLLVAVDLPFPTALAAFEVSGEPFACALLLVPEDHAPATTRGMLQAHLCEGNGAASADRIGPAMTAAFRNNPAARALPLLAAIARGVPAVVDLPYLDGCRVEVAYVP